MPDIDAWVERKLAEFPPLNQATRNRLAALLSGQSAPSADPSAPRADEAA